MPAFSMEIVVPETVQTAVVVEVTETERPDVDVGETSNVFADQERSLIAANEIDCDACEISKLLEIEVAAL